MDAVFCLVALLAIVAAYFFMTKSTGSVPSDAAAAKVAKPTVAAASDSERSPSSDGPRARRARKED